MPKHYTLDKAQDLLDDETLRHRYMAELVHKFTTLTPSRPFPELLFLHDEQRQVTFSAVLATATNQDLQAIFHLLQDPQDRVYLMDEKHPENVREWFLDVKLDHMSRRHMMENDAALRHFVLNKAERTLEDANGMQANRAFANLDRIKTDNPLPPRKEMPYKGMRATDWAEFVQSRFGRKHGIAAFSKN